MRLILPKLGHLTKGRHDDSCDLRRRDSKRKKKKMMMMTADAECQQESKLVTKSSTSEGATTDSSPVVVDSISSKNSDANLSCSISDGSHNNNINSFSSVSITNLKPMPRQRLPKSIQNDSSGDKSAQISDVPKTRRSHEERFHRNFPDLASCPDDMLIKTYHCALVTDILLQGYLYITSRWFCFYSKLFGKKKLIKIPLSLVLDVSKKKTAKFIPNAVGVTTLNKEYLFGSLLSRDNTYRVMCNAWHTYKSNSKKGGSSPESEMSETNEELLSLDSHNMTANQSESTSYEESFSNVEEDTFESCDLKMRDEAPNPAEPDRCHHDSGKPTRRKYKKSMFSLFEFIGYLLNMSSPSKTCVFLIVASVLTAMLLVSAFVLSCQLSNLEVLFARIVTKTSSPPLAPQMARIVGGVNDQSPIPTGEDDDDLIPNRAPDDVYGGEGNDCQSQKENLFLANLREISTMHHQLLNQINKILTALQRVTFNASTPAAEQLN